MTKSIPLMLGWGHTKFTKHENETLESLVVQAGQEALSDAQVEAKDIDAVVLGNYNGGMNALGFASSLALQISDDLFGVHAIRVENACASGSAAVNTAINMLLAGTAKKVLVIGAEKMSEAPANVVGAALLGADYEAAGQESTNGFAGLFAGVADEYENRYGPVSDTLAQIAAKSHQLGFQNPYAQLQKQFDFDFCSTVSDKNPLVAGILRRTDCSPVSDGAAAFVLGLEETSKAHDAIEIRGWGAASDFIVAQKRDPLAFQATELAWRTALTMAGVSLSDLDLAEVHDCFTIAELNLYEVMGITPRGEGKRAILDGTVYPDGSLPVNPSGGLKSKGHPVGATGVSQHVLTAMQLTNTFPGVQIQGARVGAVLNMGGLAIANYASVLRNPNS